MIVKSVSNDQYEILENIIKLYGVNGTFGLCCDPMYGNGMFYKNGRIPRPQCVSDINPKSLLIGKADARGVYANQPLRGEFDTVILDPPFLATTGKTLSGKCNNGSNIITKRFSCCSSEKELLALYYDILFSSYELLRPGGICIFKCQDKVSSGKQYWSHISIFEFAVEIGFKVEDLFILIANARLTPKWQVEGQKHARKYHSYFIVLRRPDAKKTS